MDTAFEKRAITAVSRRLGFSDSSYQKKKPMMDVLSLSAVLWPAGCYIWLTWRCHHCEGGQQNAGLCSALMVFEQGGVFIVPRLLRHGISFSGVSTDESPQFSRLTRQERGTEETINSDLSGHSLSTCCFYWGNLQLGSLGTFPEYMLLLTTRISRDIP